MTTTTDTREMNVGTFERRLSALTGSALLLYGAYAALGRSLLGGVIGVVGGGLVYRGVSGRCPAYGLLGIDTARREREAARTLPDRVVDEASEDSFPASDAPAWTPTTSVAQPQR